MPKIPRDISGKQLATLLLKNYKYEITRQTGSHMRLTSNFTGSTHHITIPNHNFLKIGTLNFILNDLASYLKINKQELIKKIFA